MVDVLTWQGKLAAALAAVEKAKRRDPRNSTDYRVRQGIVYTQLGQWQEGIAPLKSYLDRYPHSLWAHAYLATDYSCIDAALTCRTQASPTREPVFCDEPSPLSL